MSEAHQKGSFTLAAIGAQIGEHWKKKQTQYCTQNAMITIYMILAPSNMVVLFDILFEAHTQGTSSLIRLKRPFSSQTSCRKFGYTLEADFESNRTAGN